MIGQILQLATILGASLHSLVAVFRLLNTVAPRR